MALVYSEHNAQLEDGNVIEDSLGVSCKSILKHVQFPFGIAQKRANHPVFSPTCFFLLEAYAHRA